MNLDKPRHRKLESHPHRGWCEVCGEKAYKTYHGTVCKNGHGGAPLSPCDPKDIDNEQA